MVSMKQFEELDKSSSIQLKYQFKNDEETFKFTSSKKTIPYPEIYYFIFSKCQFFN